MICDLRIRNRWLLLRYFEHKSKPIIEFENIIYNPFTIWSFKSQFCLFQGRTSYLKAILKIRSSQSVKCKNQILLVVAYTILNHNKKEPCIILYLQFTLRGEKKVFLCLRICRPTLKKRVWTAGLLLKRATRYLGTTSRKTLTLGNNACVLKCVRAWNLYVIQKLKSCWKAATKLGSK